MKAEVRVGEWVKVERNREKFWCRVIEKRMDGALLVRVENDLVLNRKLRCGDKIVLEHRYVLGVATLADVIALRALAAASGDPVTAALVWHAERRARES